jgi:hypothetical protein
MEGKWINLRDRLNAKKERRNHLAHFMIGIYPEKKAKRERVRLEPQMLDYKYKSGIKKKVDYGIAEILAFEKIFSELAFEAIHFNSQLRQFLKVLPLKSHE